MIVGIIAVVVVAILVFACIGMYNSFIKLKNNVEEGFATMDVYLKKRYDMIPNLVEIVKGYATHEKDTLENVVKARNLAQQSIETNQRIESENMLDSALKNLFALAENYPDLKANQNFNELQRQLETVEEDIANSRKYYNAVVKMFNTKCQMFPSNIIASIFKFKEYNMFEVDNNQQRENVKVEF